MATVTISDSKKFVYITDGSVSADTITYTGNQKVVKVASFQVDEDATNDAKSTSIPVSRGNWTATAPRNRIIDLKRIKRVFTINGFLITEAGVETKETKRDNLRILAGLDTTTMRGGTLTAVWGVDGTDRQEHTVLIQKMKITDTEKHLDKFPVIISLLVGTNR